MNQKIYIGSDHAGFEMKRDLLEYLKGQKFDVMDCGPTEYNHDDDYPDYISVVAGHVSKEPESRGIVIGYSGQGEAIVSNRFPGVRCSVFYGGSKHVITLSREHNDVNVISFGSNFITNEEARRAVDLFLHTKFSGDERHKRRIMKIERVNANIKNQNEK